MSYTILIKIMLLLRILTDKMRKTNLWKILTMNYLRIVKLLIYLKLKKLWFWFLSCLSIRKLWNWFLLFLLLIFINHLLFLLYHIRWCNFLFNLHQFHFTYIYIYFYIYYLLPIYVRLSYFLNQYKDQDDK